MAALDGAHLDAVDLADGAAENLGIDVLDACPVGAKPALADDERQRDGINSEDQGPFLRNNVQQAIDSIGLDGCKHSGMDGRDRPRMTASEGNQILIGLFDGPETLPQVRHCTLFEWDYRGHRVEEYA
jgi:hypothetical protein